MRPLHAALLVLLAPGLVLAQARDPASWGSWAELVEPERRQAIHHLRDGLAHLLLALGDEDDLDPGLGDDPRWLLIERALIRFERARRALPRDPELAYYTAVALTHYERRGPDGGTEHRTEEALDAWQRLREVAPAFLPDRVANHLAMLRMRRHEFVEARAEYEAALRHAAPSTVELFDRFFIPTRQERQLGILFAPLYLPNVHGNLAEAAMLTGDLESAVTHYREARDGAQEGITRTLALWGLALALDRRGAHEEAIREAQRAIREDPVRAAQLAPVTPDAPALPDALRRHRFAILHLEGVFFEPPCEIRAYEALGYEAVGRLEDGSADDLRHALRSWRLFLAEGGTASRYAPIARAHIERLEREVGPAVPASVTRPPRSAGPARAAR